MTKSDGRRKKRIHERDKYSCFYCGIKAEVTGLQIDHVVPRWRGGGNHADNLVTSCIRCNRFKGGLTVGGFLEKAMRNYEYHHKEKFYWLKIIRNHTRRR